MWIYEDEPFTEPASDLAGFVYLITRLSDGRKYIGKKTFWNKVSRPPLKGKKRRRISYVQSDWSSYYGSSEELSQSVDELGPQAFSRVILHLCKTRSEMSYLEAKEQFSRDVLLDPAYFNKWISVKVTSKHLT